MSSILAPSIRPDVSEPTFYSIICIEVLEIFQLAITNLSSSIDEVVFRADSPEGAA